jgi:hypothetical protein
MSAPIIVVEVLAAQPPKKPVSKSNNFPTEYIFMGSSAVLLLLLIAFAIYHKIQMQKMTKKFSVEEFKNRDLQKKYKLAVETIGKMERNPDLINSREFNLDYLRMRMSEELFHFGILNQIKVKVKQQITVALLPTQVAVGEKPTAGTSRQVDAVFDVEHETGEAGKDLRKRVLFRIGIKLTKLPTQATSQTINQIIDCLETYLSPDEQDNWTPTIQGRIVRIDWDQKAKPTPLLILAQSDSEGVVFKTNKGKPKATKGPSTSMDAQGTTMLITPPATRTRITPGSKTSLKGKGTQGKGPDKTRLQK